MDKDFWNNSSKKRGRPKKNSKDVQNREVRKQKLSDKKD
jgi:AT hook motif.